MVDGQRERCSHCQGDGRVRCNKCWGDGMVKCKDCDGEGRIVRFLQLKVKFTNHREVVVLDNRDIPQNVISEAAKTVICK